MSCDKTTLYVRISSLSGTSVESVSFSSLTGTVAGNLGSINLPATATGISGTGTGTLDTLLVPTTATPITGSIYGGLNTLTLNPSANLTGTISGTFSVGTQYTIIENFTGILNGSSGGIGPVYNLSAVDITGGTLSGNNYAAGIKVYSTPLTGTLSTANAAMTAVSGAVNDEYIQGFITSPDFTNKLAKGTMSKVATASTVTITITSVQAITNWPYSVHVVDSMSATGSITDTISGVTKSEALTAGTISSTNLNYVLTGSNLINHNIRGIISTSSLASKSIIGTINKSGSSYTGTIAQVDGTYTIPVVVTTLSSIPVDGTYWNDPGTFSASVSGVTLTGVISSGSISSTTSNTILSTDTITDHPISGNVNSALLGTNIGVSGTISTYGNVSAMEYTGPLTFIDSHIPVSIRTYELSSITIQGTVGGSVSGETVNKSITGALSSDTITYIASTDSVSAHSITGVASTSADLIVGLAGVLTTSGSSCTATFTTVDDLSVNVPAYTLSSIAVTGGSLTQTYTTTAWDESNTLNVNITGGTLSSGTLSYILTSTSLSNHTLTGTLSTDKGTLSTIVTGNSTGIALSGTTDDVTTLTSSLTVTPASSIVDKYFIHTTGISSGPLSTVSTASTATISGTLDASTTTVISALPVTISGILPTIPMKASSLLSADNVTGSFTINSGGMSGTGGSHDMLSIPVTGGTLTGSGLVQFGCATEYRTITAGTLSSPSLTVLPISSTLSGHTVAGNVSTNNGEAIPVEGTLDKTVSGTSWSGVLTSKDGSSILNITGYGVSSFDITSGTVTGSVSGKSISADITSETLSSTTLSFMMTCLALTSHPVTGTITTSDGTAWVNGTVSTNLTSTSAFTGALTAQYPVTLPVYELSSIPVTGGIFTNGVSGSGLIGTISSSTVNSILTSTNLTSAVIAGNISNNSYTVSALSGSISTTNNTFTGAVTGQAVSSWTLTAEVLSNFPNKTINVGRGNTYTFVLTTPWSGLHPFRISETIDGIHSLGTQYTRNVVGDGGDSPGDEVKIKIDHLTPTTLYYYSEADQAFGGTININAACNVIDNSQQTDSDTSAVTVRQKDKKASDVTFTFNKKVLSGVKLDNDTKYTFFVNNSTSSPFQILDSSGKGAALGSRRMATKDNIVGSNVTSFVKETSRDIITTSNYNKTDITVTPIFAGSVGGVSLETTPQRDPDETGKRTTEWPIQPGSTDPLYYDTTVDCSAPELTKYVRPNTLYTMSLYSRSKTDVYKSTTTRSEFNTDPGYTWSLTGIVSASWDSTTVSFTGTVPGRDPELITGSGTVADLTYPYTWSGDTNSGTDTVSGDGTLEFDLGGNATGDWVLKDYTGTAQASGSDYWELSAQILSAVETSVLTGTPIPTEYKSRADVALHTTFSTSDAPVAVDYGSEYKHPNSITIGPFEHDVTIFAGSDIWTNGTLYLDINGVHNIFTTSLSDSDVGNAAKFSNASILYELKAGDTGYVYLKGTDSHNLWAMGNLSYIESVCMTVFGFTRWAVGVNLGGQDYYDASVFLDPRGTGVTTITSMYVPYSAENGEQINQNWRFRGGALMEVRHRPEEVEGITYRWYKRPMEASTPQLIPGAISNILNIMGSHEEIGGYYHCEVETLNDLKTTSTVYLSVHEPASQADKILFDYELYDFGFQPWLPGYWD